MIGQATGHRRRTIPSPMLGFREFLMRPTEIVRAANQVHSRVQRLQARSCMPTLTGEAGQSLTHGSIQPLNESGIEHGSSIRELEQLLCLIE